MRALVELFSEAGQLMEGPLMFCASDLLQKPVEDLLMNQSNRFRETQEQRELISRGLSTLHHGHVTINSSCITFPTKAQVHYRYSVPFQVNHFDIR